MKSKMRTWNVAMGSLSLLFLCVSPALAIATNPSQENPYTERNDDSVTQQRTRKVTGVVLDANGESIIGANVVVKGTNNGTITDLDGKFSIELSDGETLQVSFIGYNSKDVMVGAGENHIKVQLREDTQKLDEVVVVGYGTQIKRAVTGSVQSIKSEEMADMPVAQISQKMQGKFAGVQINQVSGKPGQGMTMRIRGQASLSGGTTPPLCSGWNAYRGRYQHDQSRRDRKYQCAKRRFCHITLRFPGCQWSRIDTDKDCPIREKTKRRRIWRHTIRTREREAGYDGCLRIRTVQERDR